MAVETIQQTQERDASYRCICDQNVFMGDFGEENDSESAPQSAPVHIGLFQGFDTDDGSTIASNSGSSSRNSVRSLTMGNVEDDQEIITKMIKSGGTRLKRECIDDNVLANIEENGTVGALQHSDIAIGEFLGVGSFSSVFSIKPLKPKVRERLTKTAGEPLPQDLVIKILKPSLVLRPSELSMCAADLVKEGVILGMLGRHQNVISLVAWTPTGLGGFSDNRCGIRHDSFFLVMDKLQESLKDRLDGWRKGKSMHKNNLFLRERFTIMTDLANAIQHVHSKGIIHRDLKPNNIGFDPLGTLKLFDFDVSRIIPTDVEPKASDTGKAEDASFRLTQHVGTQRYMSPECAKGERYNCKSDVYAFGLICHEILSLKIPYHHIRRSEEHYQKVFLAHERPNLPWKWPKSLRHFLGGCWSHYYTNRPTMERAFKFLCAESDTIVDSMEKRNLGKSVMAVLGGKDSSSKSRGLFGRKTFDHKQDNASATTEKSSIAGSCHLTTAHC